MFIVWTGRDAHGRQGEGGKAADRSIEEALPAKKKPSDESSGMLIDRRSSWRIDGQRSMSYER